jgi:F-type H+-transporting ATPase subunit delta
VIPYAKALFDVALSDGRPDDVGQEVTRIAEVFASHAELHRVLTHPAVPARAKREVIDRIAGELSVSTPLRRLLGLMAERDRLGLIPQLHEAYHARLMQHLGVVEAHVTTAVPLPPDRAEALRAGLARATGREVRMTTSVDPAIMGGAVAKVGSLVFDGSVARQLEKLREQLAAAG